MRTWPLRAVRRGTARFAQGAGLLLVALAGCGGPVETVPVTGNVTFDGGPPPSDGAIYFQPIKPAEGYASRPGFANFAADGSYASKTGTSVGLVPGQYQVHIECWKSPPNMEGKPVISHLPEKYQSNSTNGFETVEVTPESGAVEYDLHIDTTQ